MQYTTAGPGGRWLYTVAGWQEDFILALSTDSSGDTIAVVMDSSYATPPDPANVILRKLDSSGRLIWERPLQRTGHGPSFAGMGTDAADNIYILYTACNDEGCHGTIDFGNGPSAAGLVKLSPTGELISHTALAMEGPYGLAVNAQGEAAFAWCGEQCGGFGSVVKVAANGIVAWSRGARTIGRVAIDPAGNVLVGGATYPGDAFFDVSFPTEGPAVAKLAASNGANVWVEQLASASGYPTGIGSSALGTVVVAAQVDGPFSFAGRSHAAGSYLLVLEQNGAHRFARRLPGPAPLPPHAGSLAVDPPGKVSVLSARYENPTGFAVNWYDLAGNYLGQLEFPASSAPGNIGTNGIAIASDHSTVVSGHYSELTDGSVFGTTGSVASAGTGLHAFIVGGLFRAGGPSFLDRFDRTALGPNWDVPHGTFVDDGSAARGTSFGSYAFWTGVPGPNDSAEVTVTGPRNLGAIVRGDPGDPDRNHYVGYVDMSGYIRIARRRNWVYSYLAIGPRFPSGSHALSITATGSAPVRLAVQLDGTPVLTYDDVSPAALTGGGKAGMFDYNGLSQPIDTFRVIRR